MRNELATSRTRLSFTWSTGTSNGGSDVLDYRISYDQGTGSFINLATGVISTSYTTTISITPSATYEFKVQARNIIGFSPVSVGLMITAAIVPTAPTAVVTTVLANDVVVTWDPPSYDSLTDYGASITAF